MHVDSDGKALCRRVEDDVRRHLVPIVVAVIAAEILRRLGIIATVVFVVVCAALAKLQQITL